jgi:hypothetical protein
MGCAGLAQFSFVLLLGAEVTLAGDEALAG